MTSYKLKMKEIILNVEGMSCEGCENRIKNALGNIEGVKDVKADFKTGIVKVNSNENVTKESLEETIIDIGFEVKK